jgi:hypothetical protein
MSVHMRLAAETHLADGEFLQVAVNRKEFIKLRGKTRKPVISKREGHFNNNNNNNNSTGHRNDTQMVHTHTHTHTHTETSM